MPRVQVLLPLPNRLLWLRWQSTSLVRMRSPVRIWLAAPTKIPIDCMGMRSIGIFAILILAAALPAHTAAHRCLGCVHRRRWQCLSSAVCAAARGRAGRRITGCDSLSTVACVTWYRQGDLVMTGSWPALPRITLRPKGSYPLPIIAFPYVDKRP